MFILRNRAPERFAAGGGPKGLNAVSQMQLDRLKKQWIAEHEAGKPNVSVAEVKDSIDQKIEVIRRRFQREAEHRWAALSEETRAAWTHFLSLRDRDLAAMEADAKTRKVLDVAWDARSDHFDPPEVRHLPSPKRTAEEEENRHPPEGWSYGQPKPAPPPRTEWTIRDEDFDP